MNPYNEIRLERTYEGFKKVSSECEADLLSIGIQPGNVNQWVINTRTKCRWGLCKQVAPGEFVISIANRLQQGTVSDQAAKNTILHELLHTVKECHGHKGQWKELAAKVNRRLPHYTIKRTTSYEEKGLEYKPKARTNLYAVKCTHCGKEYYREKESKLIQYPDKYRCGVCNNPLKRIR